MRIQSNEQSGNTATTDTARAAVDQFLAQHEAKGLLRLLTCGSVDDGKSTLLGRLLYDSQLLFDDQLSALEGESRRYGTQGEELDFALLVDGLVAEREQGITIDVAYRYFSTTRRKFIVADCPGHEQYTRNMATGASTADLAIVLVDARKGLQQQTRRHSWICQLLGIRHVVLAVNKMDLIDYHEDAFRQIESEYLQLAKHLGLAQVTVIPLSALKGDNIVMPSQRMNWYAGPALLEHLETVSITASANAGGFRLPVQWVCRPDQGFRGYAGEVATGHIRVGDGAVVLPSGARSRIARIVTADGDLPEASAGAAVTLTLEDEIDASRGDVIASIAQPAPVADRFAAHLLWMHDAPLLPGRAYWLRSATRTVGARASAIDHRIDINTQQQLAADRLQLNEVGRCQLQLDHSIAFDPYESCHQLGAFILIDRQSGSTVAAGRLDEALDSERHIQRQPLQVSAQARAHIKGQQPACLWFTGLSGAGKSTLANEVERLLHASGYHTCVLDGDNLRHGLNRDLGFSAADRAENIRRVAAVARLMVDAGLIVLVSAISPQRSERNRARQLFDAGQFHEIFVDAPLSECERRDVKGLYAKARAGELRGFTGIDAPYEAPQNPEFHLRTDQQTVAVQAQALVNALLAT